LTEALVGPKSGRHVPRSYEELLGIFNGHRGIGGLYGVHGIDDNPRRHPYANARIQTRSCSVDADCHSEGNRCVRGPSGKKSCSMICLDDSGCSDGYHCKAIGSLATTTVVGKACVR
jgi:hypothetical protein